MGIISLDCKNCGSQLQLDDSKDIAFCVHCGSKIKIMEEINNISNTYNQTITNNIVEHNYSIDGKKAGVFLNELKTLMNAMLYDQAYEVTSTLMKNFPADYRSYLAKAIYHSNNMKNGGNPLFFEYYEKALELASADQKLEIIATFEPCVRVKYFLDNTRHEIETYLASKKLENHCFANRIETMYGCVPYIKDVETQDICKSLHCAILFVGDEATQLWGSNRNDYSLLDIPQVMILGKNFDILRINSYAASQNLRKTTAVVCLSKKPPIVDGYKCTSFSTYQLESSYFSGKVFVAPEHLGNYRRHEFWGKCNLETIMPNMDVIQEDNFLNYRDYIFALRRNDLSIKAAKEAKIKEKEERKLAKIKVKEEKKLARRKAKEEKY